MTVLGLDYKLYLKVKDISHEEKLIAEFELLEKFELAKIYNFKYLYNGNIDYIDLEEYINLLNFKCDDFSSYALVIDNVFEYIEKTYAYSNNINIVDDYIDNSFVSYIIPVFEELNNNYGHQLFISFEKRTVLFEETSYFFLDNFQDEDFVLTTLPKVTSIDDFYSLFHFYFWFYSKENMVKIKTSEILLSENFKNQISQLDANNLSNILTSLFRGIFYPDYLHSKGVIDSSKYIIETHPDKKIKSLKIGNERNSLYRIHCVTSSQKKGGKNRICYTTYSLNKVVVFYYAMDHCENLKHYERLNKTLNIFSLNNDTKCFNEEIELNVK